MGAEGRGTRVVVVTGFFDDGEAGEKTLQIEPEMKFGGGFATAMFGPVPAVGHQGNGR